MTRAEIRKRQRTRQLRRIRRTLVSVVLLLCMLTGFVLHQKGKLSLLAASNIKSAPEQLQELYQNNPETLEFVSHYEENKKHPKKLSIKKDVKRGTIPLFLQWDERWGYRDYGNSFIAINGCGPTCLSMVYSGLTGKTNYNPYTVAKKAEREGYYVAGTGTSWDMMTRMAGEMGLIAREQRFEKDAILQNLRNGVPMIVILGPGDFTTKGHFIVLCGIDENENVVVHDPNSKKRSEKHWDITLLMEQIRNIWCYRLSETT
ncbi:Peptidase_C39 like family protein [Lachnospiraceae bacterium XBB1006]|nr:Peptidase_C39 like family protein [Lachnospiraceae bacterium XBB1006]